MVTNTISDQSLVQAVAQSGGLDPKGLALVYHVAGSSFGDTLDVVTTNNGAIVVTEFGFFFGDDSTPGQPVGRTALTNSTLTEVRRLDYVYTSQSPDARGAAFVTKRYVRDRLGNIRPTIDAQMEWLDWQTGSPNASICKGSFTTGKVLY